MTLDRDVVRSRILADAERDLVDVWPWVMSSRLALVQAFEGVTSAQADWRPGAGTGESDWGIREVAAHVVQYTNNVVEIIEHTARGEVAPKDPPGTLPPEAPADFEVLRRSMVQASRRLASVHERIPDPPSAETTVPHPVFGPLHSKAWFVFFRIHDGDHARQIERLKAHPEFPRS